MATTTKSQAIDDPRDSDPTDEPLYVRTMNAFRQLTEGEAVDVYYVELPGGRYALVPNVIYSAIQRETVERMRQ